MAPVNTDKHSFFLKSSAGALSVLKSRICWDRKRRTALKSLHGLFPENQPHAEPCFLKSPRFGGTGRFSSLLRGSGPTLR